MWFIGFDVFCVYMMYLDKLLVGYNLMQVIVCVNCVYGEKFGGLIVDMIGLVDLLVDVLVMYVSVMGEIDKLVKELQDEVILVM